MSFTIDHHILDAGHISLLVESGIACSTPSSVGKCIMCIKQPGKLEDPEDQHEEYRRDYRKLCYR